MVVPTPWRMDTRPATDPGSGVSRQQLAAESLQRTATVLWGRFDIPAWEAMLRRYWGVLLSAAGSVTIMVVLFKPWLIGFSPDGEVDVTGFGRVTITASLDWLWSSNPPPLTSATGKWAILAVAAGIVTVTVVALNLRKHNEKLTLAAIASSVVVAASVVLTMLYLNSRGEALRDLAGDGDQLTWGTQVGEWIRAFSIHRTYPVPGLRQIEYFTNRLTNWAIFSAVISLVAALAPIAQWFYEHRSAAELAAASGRARDGSVADHDAFLDADSEPADSANNHPEINGGSWGTAGVSPSHRR